MEPPLKKIKLSDKDNILLDTIDKCIETIQNSDNQLQAVLNDDIYKQLPLVNVYVGHINNVKDISRTVLTLNEKVPLKKLQHLKRVRGLNIILCPTDFIAENSSIQDFMETNVGELKDVFKFFKVVEVPSVPPKVQRQFVEAKKIWSCNFHPNPELEKLVNNTFFSKHELQRHKKYMRLVFEIVRWYAQNRTIHYNAANFFENINASVVVDPSIDSVVAFAFDKRTEHPIQHSAMLVIDEVAKTQNGGAWADSILDSVELLPYLKEKFSHIKFECKKFISKEELQKNEDGPYLCTGYYVYILNEPCFMCAMALVHARAKRIFFCLNNLKEGALVSRTKLQEISSLNHHFDVFTGFL